MSSVARLLKPAQTVRTESSGLPCVVGPYLGGGGQGEVYRAQWAGESVALKWYFSHQATREQRAALEALIRIGSPTDKFLWPIELAGNRQSRGFGYVMPLRDPRYKSIVDLMKRRAEPTFRALVTAGIELADSFLRLHARGLCYRDISFGNVFFDPATGEVLICDNDNVGIDGAARTTVLGTPRFMAPEIVRGDASPSILTDLYALAVLLFYLLMVHHPLDGRREAAIKCMDLPAMNRLYGTQPLFIFDPADESNRPVAGLHDNATAFWPIYPEFLRTFFTRTFTVGLHEPARRIRESEWRTALVRLRDHIVTCACGMENFYCPVAEESGQPLICWSCGAPLALPPMLKISNQLIMLNADTRLYAHHLEPLRRHDFTSSLAQVSENPSRPGQWGLQNLTDDCWRLIDRSGAAASVPPGRSASLAGGFRIDFGRSLGEVTAQRPASLAGDS